MGGGQARSKSNENQMRKMNIKKKKIFTQIQSVSLSRFFTQIPMGVHGSVSRTILRYSHITGDPKGGGAWHNALPKYAPGSSTFGWKVQEKSQKC